jgi:hypothetical protein
MAEGTKRAGFVAWLVAVLVPPAVAGGLGQQFVAHHAALAVAIGMAYEAVVTAGGFFAVIARDVSSRWQKRLADRIDLFLQRKTARFERRYREFVLGGLRFMDHKGLATVGPFTPELDAVFVNVSLVPRPPQQIPPGILPDHANRRTRHRLLEDFLEGQKPAVLAVVGGPGSGKTTLLRHAAREACLRKRSHKDCRTHARDVPILLYLRDHAAAIIADPSVSVTALLRKTLGAVGADESPEWFEDKLRDGRYRRGLVALRAGTNHKVVARVSGGTCPTGGSSPPGPRMRRWSARPTLSPPRTSSPLAAPSPART